jgi:hypothetical protein
VESQTENDQTLKPLLAIINKTKLLFWVTPTNDNKEKYILHQIPNGHNSSSHIMIDCHLGFYFIVITTFIDNQFTYLNESIGGRVWQACKA